MKYRLTINETVLFQPRGLMGKEEKTMSSTEFLSSLSECAEKIEKQREDQMSPLQYASRIKTTFSITGEIK